MSSRIQITKSEFIYNAPLKKKTGRALYCESFCVKLHAIKLIGLSPRLTIDDEVLFILIISDKHKIHPILFEALNKEDFLKIENYFQLNPIIRIWGKFTYEDHYGTIDKVIYPQKYYWKDLFKKNWKLKARKLYNTLYPKSFFGNLNPKIL